ncbi:predicted protein [Lichtheimia corymbifera JMRC:FSU:9682]|uniref:Uncharacterized protein n=1 Tax=Lichtheimia corymbifera JMRC:FSU:9682 TaxID=1263082 RepID=A0A068RP99_9FUNG|nr:predicted protein [Lichtheimia corymbifera JMRC:FSU:9682]
MGVAQRWKLTEKGIDPTAGWKRKHISINIGLAVAMRDRVVVDTWCVVNRDEGSYQVHSAEDDDGLDGIDKRAHIFDESYFTAMDGIRIHKPTYAEMYLALVDEGCL